MGTGAAPVPEVAADAHPGEARARRVRRLLLEFRRRVLRAASRPRSAVVRIAAPNGDASLFIPAALQPCRGVVDVSAVLAGIHPA